MVSRGIKIIICVLKLKAVFLGRFPENKSITQTGSSMLYDRLVCTVNETIAGTIKTSLDPFAKREREREAARVFVLQLQFFITRATCKLGSSSHK